MKLKKIMYIFSMSLLSKCNFCHSYTRRGNINPCCTQNISPVMNNATTESSLLLSNQLQCYKSNYNTATATTLQYINENSASITNTIYGQLLEVRQNRYQPYQPYMPPVIPPSVMELQMNTVNVGVPHSFSSMARCKGSQSVTTSNKINY